MQKYILIAIMCLSFSAFGAKESAMVGEVNENTASARDDSRCYKKEIESCTACFRTCINQYGDVNRVKGKEVSDSGPETSSRRGSVGKQ
jgi:hypothetical protein